MIVFDLKCGAQHVFEAWFGSNVDWERQRDAGQVACPVCGDPAVQKAVMAPAVPAKANRKGDLSTVARSAAMRTLAARQTKALKNSTWVGTDFATRARAMHMGEEVQGIIHGQATLNDAKALLDDGVPVAPLLLPIIPPDKLN